MKKRVSLVLHLKDWYNGKSIDSRDIGILVEGRQVKYVQKEDGLFVLMDLENGTKTIEIECPKFAPHRFNMDIKNEGKDVPMAEISLKPSKLYPFGDTPTTVSGKLLKGSDNFIGELEVSFFVPTEQVKIAEDEARRGKTELKLYTSKGQNTLLGKYLLRQKEQGGREFCEIIGRTEEEGVYKLKEPLNNPYSRGTPLFPVLDVEPDKNGNFFACLKNIADKEQEIFLRIEKHPPDPKDLQKKSILEQSFRIQRGRNNDIGKITY